MRDAKELEGVKALGKKVEIKYNYSPELLEAFVNKHPENDYMVSLDAFEFTCICPITGQPDYAEITINYIPDNLLVESKSLKLYLTSFRNSGEFHEDCINSIMKDLKKLLNPKYIEVLGLFNPRGGIAIYPFANYGKEGTKYKEVAEKRLFDAPSLMKRRNNV